MLFKKSNAYKGYKGKIFYAPDIFSIELNRCEVINFFAEIFDFLKANIDEEKAFFIDSSNVKSVSESALMYMFALIKDRICDNYKVNGNYPMNRSARNVYKKCGFENVLKRFNGKVFKYENQMLYRGNDVNTEVAAEVCRFVCADSNVNSTMLYPALIEMMSNTIQHAYSKDNVLEKKWQLYVHKNIQFVTLIFLDTGLGIPETVKKNNIEKVKKFFAMLCGPIEAKILKSALDGEFRSSTELENRGKGLPQIRDLMSDLSVNTATVYTGKAICHKNNKNSEYDDVYGEFYGTLYEVTFLKGKQNE